MASRDYTKNQRQEHMAQWIVEGETSRVAVIELAKTEFSVSQATAYKDYEGAVRIAAHSFINDQLVTGAMALAAAQRCARDAETVAHEMLAMVTDEQGRITDEAKTEDGEPRYALSNHLGRVQSSLVRTGGLFVKIAEVSFKLRPSEMMSNDEGKELLLRALEQGVEDFTTDDKARLKAIADTSPRTEH